MVHNTFNMIDNYLYVYHLGQFFVIPSFPESLNDTMGVTYNSASPMSRSAPIFSYSHSGPRELQIALHLHRDMMYQINWRVSNAKIATGDDYVDTLIKAVEACAVPAYGVSQKMVDPPMVAVRFGNDVFIKGVVTGAVSVTYSMPLMQNNKYADVQISFTVSEVEPYDAETIFSQGSFRGIEPTLEKNFWKVI